MAPHVLYAASEVQPLVKTGGLADVAAGLTAALARHGADVRVVVPAYRGWRDAAGVATRVGALHVDGREWVLHETPRCGAPPLWLLECAELFDRPGTPYEDAAGRPWPDNGLRFGAFAHAVARLAMTGAHGFRPDVLHANDWHVGLAVPWLREYAGPRAARTTVFTIHNLAYQGVFDAAEGTALGLPPAWWHLDGVEFHGRLSHLKAGIAYADTVTTVSPTYAREIQHPAHGFGLDGLLRARSARLHGIVNGIDDEAWNPATDRALVARYDAAQSAVARRVNRRALQHELGLAADGRGLLVGVVARLSDQKGIDLLPAAAAQLRGLPLQFAVLGRGDPAVEAALSAWAAAEPGRVAVRTSHDEKLARRIIAGADVFLMPSRYEPCGLTQMYAQRYGTIPIVRRTGGLADTVVDATPATLADGSATGIQFVDADAGGIAWALRRACELHAAPAVWAGLRAAAMRRDFSWDGPAARYLQHYAAATPAQQAA